MYGHPVRKHTNTEEADSQANTEQRGWAGGVGGGGTEAERGRQGPREAEEGKAERGIPSPENGTFNSDEMISLV